MLFRRLAADHDIVEVNESKLLLKAGEAGVYDAVESFGLIAKSNKRSNESVESVSQGKGNFVLVFIHDLSLPVSAVGV